MASGGAPPASPWPGKPTRAILAAGLGSAPSRTPHEPPNGSRSARPAARAESMARDKPRRPLRRARLADVSEEPGADAWPRAARAAKATAEAADRFCRSGLKVVTGGVAELIKLVGKTGEAFGRLTPHVANVTCTFLLVSFFLVGTFVLLHRLQTIQIEQKAREFEVELREAQGRHDFEVTKLIADRISLPDGVGSTTAGLQLGDGRTVFVRINASAEARRLHSISLFLAFAFQPAPLPPSPLPPPPRLVAHRSRVISASANPLSSTFSPSSLADCARCGAGRCPTPG
mmetsp:Transcript_45769/g.103121  ORF Transcript_45769/g.103121 Transcript_45769/m.103121 type:complete len:288 (-) Transcript_45769:810-1673(-)